MRHSRSAVAIGVVVGKDVAVAGVGAGKALTGSSSTSAVRYHTRCAP